MRFTNNIIKAVKKKHTHFHFYDVAFQLYLSTAQRRIAYSILQNSTHTNICRKLNPKNLWILNPLILDF